MATRSGKTAYTKRKMNKLLSLIIKILSGVFGACLLVFLYLVIFTDTFNPLVRLYKIDVPLTAKLTASNENLFYLSGSQLDCVDFGGKEKWSSEFAGSGYSVAVSDTLECVYNGTSASVLDTKKNVLFSVPAAEYTFLDAKCGSSCVAILSCLQGDTALYYIRVFNYAGEEIYRTSYENADVLSFDLFGDTDNLWVLTLDTTGVSPVSRISTFSPSQNAMTGTIDISDQLISDVFYADATMYLSGTYNLLSYDTFGQKQQSTLVYGLKCIDSVFSGNNYTLIYMQHSDDDVSQASTLRVLSGSEGNEVDSFLQLPSDVVSVYASSSYVYCFLEDSVYAYKLTGEFYKEIKLDFELKKAVKISADKVALYSADSETYYMRLS